MDTTTVFPVARFGYGEQLGIRAVALSSDPNGASPTFWVQVSMAFPSDEDIENGWDTYCLVDDRHGMHFGGVLGLHLDRNRVRMRLGDDAARELRVGPAVEFRFEDETLARLAHTRLADLIGPLR